MIQRKQSTWILLATILGSSMVFIDSSVVNVALPRLQTDLAASVTSVQWVVEVYILFLAALMLVGGSLGDLWGRKRVFAMGIVLFALSSVWCGLAPNVSQLIAARAVQGIGGALLTPGSLAIIRSSFPGEQRSRAVGRWSSFTAITSALGPLLGGWLVQHASWRWIFFINVPLALVVLSILYWRVPESRHEWESSPLDWLGALLAALGLGAIVYGLIESNNLGLGHPVVLVALVSGGIALVAFVLVELHSEAPMMPLRLFHSWTFSGTNLLTLLLYAASLGTFFFLPFNLIGVQGYSPTAAGAAVLPYTLLLFLLSRWSGGLVNRYGAKLPLVIGPLIASLGFLIFAVPDIGGSYWTTFFPAIVILGLGMAITVAPLTTTVLGAVDDRYAGIASGINNAVSRIAGLLSIAILSIFVVRVFNTTLDVRIAMLHISPTVKHALDAQRNMLVGAQIPASVQGMTRRAVQQAINESFVASFRLAMEIAAGLALASALCSLLLVAPGRDRFSASTMGVQPQGGHGKAAPMEAYRRYNSNK
jgi:EmrB/QacA subfamily drug resistance transporter